MEMLSKVSELENLVARIQATNMLFESDAYKQREREAREAFDRNASFLERLFGSGAGRTQAACPVRDEIYTQLPEKLMVSRSIAFFLAADHQTFMSTMNEIQKSYDSASNANMAGMGIDLVTSAVKPWNLAKLGMKVLKSWSIMFDHINGSDQATASRDKIALSVLTVYRLTEIQPDSYMLVRGKWGIDSLYGQYTSTHSLEMKENGIADGFDFEKLKSHAVIDTW